MLILVEKGIASEFDLSEYAGGNSASARLA